MAMKHFLLRSTLMPRRFKQCVQGPTIRKMLRTVSFHLFTLHAMNNMVLAFLGLYGFKLSYCSLDPAIHMLESAHYWIWETVLAVLPWVSMTIN